MTGTVHLVDDDAGVRDSLAALLDLRGIAVRTYSGADEFLGACRPRWRGCVLTDLCMPGLSGLDLHSGLRSRGIALPVVVLTAHGDVATTRVAMKAGVFDFLEKPVEDDLLLDVLRNALAADADRREAARRGRELRTGVHSLTPREAEVMRLVVEGLQNREIARRLESSPRTVEVYKARTLEKLQCRSIAELVRVALGERAGVEDPRARPGTA